MLMKTSTRIILIGPVALQRLVALAMVMPRRTRTSCISHTSRGKLESSSQTVPKPFELQIDNDAARIFANGTCCRSRMKHTDCAQEWVRILRDKLQLHASPLGSALMTILQTSSPKYSPLRNSALCEVALWWSAQAKLSVTLIAIQNKKAMMNI